MLPKFAATMATFPAVLLILLVGNASGFLLTHHDDIYGGHPTMAAVSFTGAPDSAAAIPIPRREDDEANLEGSTTTTGDPLQKSCNLRRSIVYSAPKSTLLMLNSPAINSFVLVRGWKEDSLERFTDAVHNVALANPILTGRARVFNFFSSDGPQIGVDECCFAPGNQNDFSFVQTIDLRVVDNLPSPVEHQNSTAALLDYINEHVAPRIRPHDTTIQQIMNGSPLFGAQVVLLPDDYACICVRLSHCVGDFVTYYELMDQISSIDRKGKDHPIQHPIHWDNALMPKHELMPEELTDRDYHLLYGEPFMIGLLSHLPFMNCRKQEILLLSKRKIKRKQKELQAALGGDTEPITANEVIMAALCDANQSSDIFAFTRSMRGIKPGLGLRDGGNLLCEISFPRAAGRDPLVIKDILHKGRYYEPNEIPIWTSFLGRVGRISNCIAPANLMSFGGCKPLVYCPPKSFLDFTPLDTAIVFRASQHYEGILHNFGEMNHNSQQLLDIMVFEGEEGSI